jgi:hypothetical protein
VTSAGSKRLARALARAAANPLAWAIVAALALLGHCIAGQVSLLYGPIVGYHEWRGAATYSVAYNYLHTSWSFFYPRVDWRDGVPSGITTMELPGYPYLSALVMRALGDAPRVCRTVNLVGQLLALASFAVLALRIRRVGLAVGFFVAWAAMPAVAMEFRQIQPDPFLVSWAVVAACFFFLHAERPRRTYYAIGLVAYALACASKPTAIALAPAMLLFALGGKKRPPAVLLRRGLPLLLPVAIALLWHAWSQHTLAAYRHAIFETQLPFDRIVKDLRDGEIWRKTYATFVPRYVTGWLVWPLTLTGMAVGFVRRRRALSLPFWAWLWGAAFAAAITGSRLTANLYYLDLLIAPCAYFAALVVEALLEAALGAERGWELNWVVVSVLLVCLVTFGAAPTDVGTGGAGVGLWFTGKGAALSIVVAIGGVLASSVSSKRAPLWRWPAIGALIVLLATTARARHAAERWATELAGSSEWPDPPSDVWELRTAVNRYSSRDDPIIVDLKNPAALHWPLRWGWATDPTFVGLQMVVAKGVDGATLNLSPRPHLYIHYRWAGDPPPDLNIFRRLAATEQWTLYCTDPHGCPARN